MARRIRPRIYVSGPLSDGGRLDVTEQGRCTDRAIDVAQLLIELGYAPLNPHLTFFHERHLFDNGRSTNAHDVWLQVDKPWVLVSDAILRLDGASVGADQEVRWAHKAGIPVFRSFEALRQSLPPR